MNKIKKTKKVNNYISLEYEPNDLRVIRIWYDGIRYGSNYALYDINEKRFICSLNFTNKQTELIINAINKLIKKEVNTWI